MKVFCGKVVVTLEIDEVHVEVLAAMRNVNFDRVEVELDSGVSQLQLLKCLERNMTICAKSRQLIIRELVKTRRVDALDGWIRDHEVGRSLHSLRIQDVKDLKVEHPRRPTLEPANCHLNMILS